MKESEALIERLKELKNDDSDRSYTHIKNILFNQIFPIAFITYKPFRLIRTRSHKKDEILFKKIKDLSFNKDILNINYFGRSNEPGQGLFYCNDNLNEGTAFSETMNLFRNNPHSDQEVITIGAWQVDRELKLAVILPSEFKEIASSLINSASKSYNYLDDGTDNYRDLKATIEFIANEFTLDLITDKSNYKVTCAFTNYIKSKFPSVDGIVYASVKSELKGENIVLWEHVADKNLMLIGARKRTFKLINKEDFFETEYCDSDKINYNSGQITWKKPVSNTVYNSL